MSIQLKNQFDTATIQKVIRGSLIAGGGAMAIYLLTWFTTLDLGQLTPMAVAISSILINALKEYKKGSDTIR